MNAQPHEEFCPRCGQWVDTLSDVGWCALCSVESGRRCTRCDQYKPLDHYARDKARVGVQGGRRPVCRACDTARRRLREQAKRLLVDATIPVRARGDNHA